MKQEKIEVKDKEIEVGWLAVLNRIIIPSLAGFGMFWVLMLTGNNVWFAMFFSLITASAIAFFLTGELIARILLEKELDKRAKR